MMTATKRTTSVPELIDRGDSVAGALYTIAGWWYTPLKKYARQLGV